MRSIYCLHCALSFSIGPSQRVVTCARCGCAFDVSNVAWPSIGLPAQAPAPAPAPVLPRPVSFFHDATGVVAPIEAALGPGVKIQELTVFDGYVCFDAQDPREPENVDSYVLRGGSVERGRPITFEGSRKRLEATLMGLDEIPFAMLPRLCTDAVERLKIKGGTPSHIVVNRFAASAKANRLVSVYVNSERKGSGYVDYDLKGKARTVMGP